MISTMKMIYIQIFLILTYEFLNRDRERSKLNIIMNLSLLLSAVLLGLIVKFNM